MKIEIWSDYVCPFCFIGKRKLEMALEKTGMDEKAVIEFKSFELDSNACKNYEESIDELMAKKYGMSLDQARAANNNIIKVAQEVGLQFNFEGLKPTNTFDAHRLSHYAKIEGKLKEYTAAVMKSYFTESLNISDFNVLASISEEVGMNREKALSILESSEFTTELRGDVARAMERGVHGVPYFLFDGEVAVSGAQAVDTFMKVIEELS